MIVSLCRGIRRFVYRLFNNVPDNRSAVDKWLDKSDRKWWHWSRGPASIRILERRDYQARPHIDLESIVGREIIQDQPLFIIRGHRSSRPQHLHFAPVDKTRPRPGDSLPDPFGQRIRICL